MGVVRAAGQGCMCPANALVRALIRHLVIQRNEVVILDMEAGTEHFGRRTAENVDVMLIVANANLKSLETAKKIYGLSKEIGVKKVFVIGNKILDPIEKEVVKGYCDNNNIPFLAIIPYDKSIRKSDMEGEALDLSKESSGLKVIQTVSKKLELFGETIRKKPI
jgi:CO dehydrogenase maturation factor